MTFRAIAARPSLVVIRKAEGPLRAFSDDWWATLAQLADALAPEVRRLFLQAIERLQSLDTAAAERALARRDIDGALQAIPWEGLAQDHALVRERLIELIEDSFRVTLSATARQAGIEFGFDVPSSEAITWARRHVGRRIQGITAETRQAIREVIALQLDRGATPRESARQIRQLVGLNRRQARAVENLRATLAKEGAAEDRIERLTAQYAARLHRQRADDIARTETMEASHQGQRLVWQRAAVEGLLDPAAWVREWVAVVPDPDRRTCPICEELDGTNAPLFGLYPPTPRTPEGTEGPTRHPKCRCVERLVRRRGRPSAEALAEDAGRLIMEPGDEPRQLGRLSEGVPLPAIADTRDVWIGYGAYEHFVARRLEQGGYVDVDLIQRRISEVITDPTHVGRRTTDPRRIEVFRRWEGDTPGVLVTLKIVPGDRIWVTTAMPAGVQTLKRLLGSGKLRELGT